jgi:glycosyltransferase EpsJ
MQKSDNRIIIERQKNMGCGDARNTGLMLAKGKYIVFVDSDDFIKCNMIKKLYSNMLKSDLDLLMFEAKVIYSGIKSKYSNIKKNRYIKKCKYLEIQSGIDLFTKMRKNSEFSSVVWIMMYKKELLDRYNIQFIPRVLHKDIFFIF